MTTFFISSALAADADVVVGDTETATGQAVPADLSPQKMMTDNLMILGLLFFIFYFMLIRPQQRRLKAHQKMIKELAKGAKVITGGGLLGTIVKFEGDDVVVVEIAPDVRVRVARSTISDVADDSAGKKTANDN